MAEQSAKGVVNQFYHKCRAGIPEYACTQDTVDGKFEWSCTVTCPAVTLNGHAVPSLLHDVVGPTKKICLATAAQQVLADLTPTEAYQSSLPPSELWKAVQTALTDRGLFKNIALRGENFLANRLHNGWLPLARMCNTASVQQWFQRFAPDKKLDMEAMMDHLLLVFNSAAADLDSDLDLTLDPPRLRRKVKFKDDPGHGKVPAEAILDDSIRFGQDTATIQAPEPAHVAIIVPADLRKEIHECQLVASQDYTAVLAAALKTEAAHLLNWHKIGRQVTASVPDGVTSEDDLDQRLQERLTLLIGHPPHSLCREADEDDSAPGAKEADDDSGSALTGADKPNKMHVRPPIMYTSWRPADERAASTVNQRASWLVGYKVHGDALLAHCRMRASEWNTPVISRRSFDLQQFWLWASYLVPEHQYAVGRQQPAFARLPTSYRTPKAWFGQQPQALLNKYTELCCCRKLPRYRVTLACDAPHSDADAAAPHQPDCPSLAKPDVQAQPEAEESATSADQPLQSRLIASVSVQPAGHEAALEASAEVAGPGGPAQIDVAKQQAALSVLHQLQGLFLGLLQPAPAHENGGGADAAFVPGPRLVQIIKQGSAFTSENMPEDCTPVVTLDYSITFTPAAIMPSSDASLPDAEGHEPTATRTIEHVAAAKHHADASSIVEGASAIIHGLGVKGSATWRQRLPANGPDYFGLAWHLDCKIQVEVVNRKFARMPGAPASPTVFSPAVARQRHSYIAQMAARFGASRLVDLGCGEASLFRHILEDSQASASLQQLVGIDISATALARGSKRLAAILDPDSEFPQPPPETQPSSLSASIFGTPDQLLGSSMQACFGDVAIDPLLALPDLPNSLSFPQQQTDPRSGRQPATGWSMAANGRALENKQGAEAGLPAVMESIWSSTAPAADGVVAQSRPAIDMLVGNICCQELASPDAWASLHGCDMAVIEEVIEHLDPLPLQQFPAAVLGSLQPRAAIVTTPNVEYNRVLKRLRGSVLPTGLRNSDHRFEWTRQEFEVWARDLGQQYGYDVEMDGIGTAVDEESAVGMQPALGDVGFSTQVAIFKRAPHRQQQELPSKPGAGSLSSMQMWQNGISQGGKAASQTCGGLSALQAGNGMADLQTGRLAMDTSARPDQGLFFSRPPKRRREQVPFRARKLVAP